MRYFYNTGSVNYKPNTLNNNEPKDYPKGKGKPIHVEGNIVSEVIDKENDFKQAGDRFRCMSDKEKIH